MNNSVFLHEHCISPGCGGRINREILRFTSPPDDNGGQFHHAQIQDRCTLCDKVYRQSPLSNFPCLALDQIFDDWNAAQLKRPDFDAAIKQALAQGGTYWNIEAS